MQKAKAFLLLQYFVWFGFYTIFVTLPGLVNNQSFYAPFLAITDVIIL